MGSRRRWRSAWPSAPSLAAGALLLAGCGGGAGGGTTTAPQPRIAAPVAAALEQRARSVADALADGDGCTARTRAQALVSAVTQAVNHKQIPPRLLEPLTSSANDLASRISCAPTPKPATVPPPEPKPRPKHHGKAKGHHKKKHGGGD